MVFKFKSENGNKIRGCFFSKMRSFFSADFFRDHHIGWFLIFIVGLNFLSWVALAIFLIFSGRLSFLIMHYNVYFGVDWIGDWWQVFLFPTVAAFFGILDAGLSFRLYAQKEKVIAYILLLTAFFVQIGCVIYIASFLIINY